MKSNWQPITGLASEVSALTQRSMVSANEKVMEAKESLSTTSEAVINTATDITTPATESIIEFPNAAPTNANNLSHRFIHAAKKNSENHQEIATRAEGASIATNGDNESDAEGAAKDAKDIEAAIKQLEGGDRVGHAGQALLAAGGASAGVAASGAIASAAGASTFLGSTTLGSIIGWGLVTPVGWIVGVAVAGAAAAYGLSKLVRSGGRQDRLRQEVSERLSKRLAKNRSKDAQQSTMEQLQENIANAIQNNHLSNEQAERMLELVKKGKLGVHIALTRVKHLMEAE
ncbi:MAG: hypothetical protein ACXV8Q_04875 [Methylobacter sp.]